MRALRRRLGLTQAQMAACLRLAPANGKDTVRKWESGARVPSGPTILLYELLRDGVIRPEMVTHVKIDMERLRAKDKQGADDPGFHVGTCDFCGREETSRYHLQPDDYACPDCYQKHG